MILTRAYVVTSEPYLGVGTRITMNLREGHRQEMGRAGDVPSTTGNGGHTDRAASSQNVIATSSRSIAR